MAPALLDQLPLENKVITGDALFTQRKICQKILKREGNYLFIIKGNQAELHWAIQYLFEKPARQFPFKKAEQWSRHCEKPRTMTP